MIGAIAQHVKRSSEVQSLPSSHSHAARLEDAHGLQRSS
jgi:hypothetical protein